jgi:hypothetical protein
MGKQSKRRTGGAIGNGAHVEIDQLDKMDTITIKQYLDVLGVDYMDVSSDRKKLMKRLLKARDDDRKKKETERKRSVNSWFNFVVAIVCIRFLISMKPLRAELTNYGADIEQIVHYDWIVLDIAYQRETQAAYVGILSMWLPLTPSQAAMARKNLVWWLNSAIAVLWQVCPESWMNGHFSVNWRRFTDGSFYTPILASFSSPTFASLLFHHVIIVSVITETLLDESSLSSVMIVYLLGGSLHSLFMAVSNEVLLRKQGNFYGVSGALYSCCAFQAAINPNAQFTFVGMVQLTSAQLLVAMGLLDVLELGDYESVVALLYMMGHYITVLVGVFMAIFLEGIPMFNVLENFSKSLAFGGWADPPPGGGSATGAGMGMGDGL